MQRVREAFGIVTFQALEDQKRISVVRATQAARDYCPTGPVVYAAKLLGISRSRLRRLRLKYGVTKGV